MITTAEIKAAQETMQHAIRADFLNWYLEWERVHGGHAKVKDVQEALYQRLKHMEREDAIACLDTFMGHNHDRSALALRVVLNVAWGLRI